MTELDYEAHYEPAAPRSADADRFRTAWLSARQRAAVLSAELTRRAPLLGEYAAEHAKLVRWHKEDGDTFSRMSGTITRLRAELEKRSGVIRPVPGVLDTAADYFDYVLGYLAGGGALTDRAATVAEGLRLHAAEIAAPSAPADRAAEVEQLREQHNAALRHADEVNNALMEEVQRYADGKERPVLWSVYNAMHLRAANAEGDLKRLRADRAGVLREADWIVEHCPDHGCVEPETDGCHCEIAERLRRMADEAQQAPREWCKCPSCWGWFVEEHPGEDLDELGKDLRWWSGLPEHRDAPAGEAQPADEAQQAGEAQWSRTSGFDQHDDYRTDQPAHEARQAEAAGEQQ